MRAADLDAVTLDAYGTLVTLSDPVPALMEALGAHGVERPAADVQRAFDAEAAYYRSHSHLGVVGEPLGPLQLECAGVFLRELDAPVESGAFVEEFVGSLVFEVLPGVVEALAALRTRGLALAVVSNWDATLRERLADVGLRAEVVVSSAEVGVPKPDPASLRLALERLGVRPDRALHVGDSDADELAARAAGTAFAPAPLPVAVAGLL